MDHLPEHPPRHESRARTQFRDSLAAFTKQLGLADPQSLSSAAEIVRANAEELAFLRELIDWRLETSGAPPNQFTEDRYGWRLALTGRGIPVDVEELVEGFLERGKRRNARAVFKLLLDAFGEDADCYNHLGLTEFEDENFDDACACFEKAAAAARRTFPRKITKKDMWQVLETRPYVRALRNLALTQQHAGLYAETLETCDRLDKECGDDLTASAHRASAALCMGDFELAWRSARYGCQIQPEESFIAAFAAHDLGRADDAFVHFLHAALNNRRAARMLLGEPTTRPKASQEVADHNDGVYLRRALRPYLKERSKGAIAFFRSLKASRAVAELLDEADAVVHRWSGDHKAPGWKAAFGRMNEMKTLEFARAHAKAIAAREA